MHSLRSKTISINVTNIEWQILETIIWEPMDTKTLEYTVNPVYNDHPWDQEKEVVVPRWSLFIGLICQIIIF